MKREIRQQIDCASKLIRAFRHLDDNLPAGELKSPAVKDDGNEVRIQAVHLEPQLIDIADGRVIVYRFDVHTSCQREISVVIFVIVHLRPCPKPNLNSTVPIDADSIKLCIVEFKILPD